jgi:hypothetical protein
LQSLNQLLLSVVRFLFKQRDELVDQPLVGSYNVTEEELAMYLNKGWQLTNELRSGKMLIGRAG